jgi:hypothetical protein
MNQLDIHIRYKQETGQSVNDQEVGLVRSRRQWLLDPDEVGSVADEYVFDNFGYRARIWFPDQDYIRWMEEKLMELL